MDDARDESKQGQEDVDGQILVASALEEDAQGRQNDGGDELADVRAGQRHFPSLRLSVW